MIVVMGQQMTDFDGNVLKEQIPSGETNIMGQPILKDGPPLTLRRVAMNALVAQFQDEQGLPGDEKLIRWELALKIKNATDPVDLFPEEVVKIKNCIAKLYGPGVSGQAWQLLK